MTESDEKPPAQEAASESDLLRNRRENLRRAEELGFPSSPVRFGIADTVSGIRGKFGEITDRFVREGGEWKIIERRGSIQMKFAAS